ncbi:MAG: hypothetical protein ACXABU_09025 [Candidatus Hodarchaeales archaeon]|jgi:hypothetical protein
MISLRQFTLHLCVWLILSASIVTGSAIIKEDPDFEWRVAVGDSMTYNYNEYFDLDDRDKDGSMYSQIYYTSTSDGEPVNISIKKGLIIRVEIWKLGLTAFINVTLNGILTGMDEIDSLYFFHGFVIDMTVNSQAYWENKSFQNIDHSIPDTTIIDSAFVQGDYFVQVINVTSNSGTNLLRIRKTNWKTGWFAYENERIFNETHLIREYEISTKIEGILTNLDLTRIFIPVFFLLTLLITAILTKKSLK